ncbi:MAG: hypothetical protein JO257_06590 [Deltaproteobacteria bacterium]|nr:hypothetical protein [Deltaproteobacteria bacterium]
MSFRDRAIALLVLGPIILFFARERIYNAVAGPFDVEARALVAMQEPPAHRFVRVVRDGRPLHFNELRGTGLQEVTVQATGASHDSASFLWLDEAGRRMVVRNEDIKDTGEAEVAGLVSTIEVGPVRDVAGADGLFLDCNKTGYKIGGLLFLAAGLVMIGLGLDQARRWRKASSKASRT